MGNKLDRGILPAGHTKDDFECFGPAATKDGEFAGTKLTDMGCFNQDGIDSNKFYTANICKSKKNGEWFAYFEWGRTGARDPAFQFVECSSEQDAQQEYEDQLHDKNDKRGVWATIAGMKVLRAKPGKDCYLVRPQATRSTGLPDARRICSNESIPVKTASPVNKSAPSPNIIKQTGNPPCDPQTMALLKDLNVATVSYAKGSLAGASIPTLDAINEGRQVLMEAQRRLLSVGDNVEKQIADRDMNDLTRLLYSRIPKLKAVGAPPETWVLSKNNIMSWNMDLDAFEQALMIQISTPSVMDANPLAALHPQLQMQWLDIKGDGQWIANHAQKATRNVHGNVGAMRIKNLWRVFRASDEPRFRSCQERIGKEGVHSRENPLFQPSDRLDIPAELKATYRMSKTCLLYHGTRSCNCTGVLRTGLRLPNQLKNVKLTGSLYGAGNYHADDWAKSAGYTSLRSSHWAGGDGAVKGRDAFMFINDVVLGNPYVCLSTYGDNEAPRGYHSVFGKGGVSTVRNNEFVTYKIEQCTLRYLIEFSA